VPNSQKSDTSKERIYQELRRSIVLGKLQPGEKLNLDDLANQYQTSVTPVREALQMLAQEEFVTSKPHSGYFVSQMTLKELTDLMDLRQILELAAVEQAAAQITEEQINQLENVHAEKIEGDEGAYERAVIENRQFHYLIAMASGNKELAEVLGRIHDRLARFFVYVQTAEGVEEKHRLLIDALRSRDVILARQTMLEEITETRDVTMKHVIEQDGKAWYLGKQQSA
jgi:DNA-binding GntR family transcriptional regulator